MAKGPASQVLQTALDGQSDPNLGALATELLRAFGGVAKLAAALKLEFDCAPEGGMARQRLLEGVLRAVSQASAVAKDGAPPVESLSETELEAQLLDILARRGLTHSTESPRDVPAPGNARVAA